MKRVSPKEAFVGESPFGQEGVEAEGLEAVILAVRGGEVVALVPPGTAEEEIMGAAGYIHGTVRLENARVLNFEIRRGVVGADFVDESGQLEQRRRTTGAGGLVGGRGLATGPRTAGEIMTRDVLTANPDMLVEDLAKQLAFHNISGMPVEGASGEIVGIVSEIDVIGKIGDTVGDVMTPEVISVTEETPVEQVASLMAERRIKRLPVMADGALVGIVSRADVVRALAGRF